MSLTYYLTSPDHPEVRLKLRNDFTRPIFNHNLEIKALPQTKNYGIIGTAFDYIVRFTIQHYHKNKCVAKDEWVADIAFRELQRILSPMEGMLLKKRYERSKKTYQNFLKSGKPTDNLTPMQYFWQNLIYMFVVVTWPPIFIQITGQILKI